MTKKTIKSIAQALINMDTYGAVIYGGGRRGIRAYKLLSELGFRIIGLIDRDETKEIYGIRANSLEGCTKNDSTVVITPLLSESENSALQAKLKVFFPSVLNLKLLEWFQRCLPPNDGLTYSSAHPFNHYDSPFSNSFEYEQCRKHAGDAIPYGIDLHNKEQKELIPFIGKCTQEYHSKQKQGYSFRWQDKNGMFADGDAMVYHSMIRYYKPRRIIEIGSGWSTAIALDTIEYWNDLPTRITCIEPYPERLFSVLRDKDRKILEVKQLFVQEVGLDEFEKLEANDILFIDSSHVVKAGGDVLYEYFEILRVLKRGVVIHIHDIQYPFRYPLAWIEDGRPYSEAYILQALLTKNNDYRILFWEDYICKKYKEQYERFRGPVPDAGSSFWLLKTNTE